MVNKIIIGISTGLKEMKLLSTNATGRNFLMVTKMIGMKMSREKNLGQ